jgi:succinate dehydrogenase / fumarate reductase membrane anchor subunit
VEDLVKAYAKHPVGAHYGLADWLLQRLTAVVMVAYTVFMVAFVLWCSPATYADWKGMFSGHFVRLLTMTFLVALLYHAWVGVRDIVMDYIKPTGLKLASQALVGVMLLFYLIWSVSILWAR